MNYDKLDNEELLRLALDAVATGRDADAMALLKTLLDRDPRHVHARYLLAAQHAQMGLQDRAEAGFRAVLSDAPELAIARFQLGQLLLVQGQGAEAKVVLQPLLQQPDALGAYARAMVAAADEDIAAAIGHLESGLAMSQDIPALAADMQRLRAQWQQGMAAAPQAGRDEAPAASMLLSGYGRAG